VRRCQDHEDVNAGIDKGTFHDLRRTCITNWFAHGLNEYEVMSGKKSNIGLNEKISDKFLVTSPRRAMGKEIRK